MKRVFVVLAVLAVATPALGQVQTRTRADAVGDVYRYRSETRYAEKSRDDIAAQVNTQVFELQVLGVSAEGLKLRYTLKEATVSDTSGPAMKAPLLAIVGAPLEFRMDPQGMLTRLDNWEAFKSQVLAALDKALPAGDQVRNMVHQRMDQNPTEAAQDMALSDVTTLRGVEVRGPVALGKVNSLDTRRRPPLSVVTDTSVRTPGCVLHINRVSTGATSVVQKITADADVSVKDGRVISFTQDRVERSGPSIVDERLKITRLSAPPAC